MHAAVFLARMLVADVGLRKDPWGRQRKWREHLQVMRVPVPSWITWESLIEVLHTFVPFRNFARDHLQAALEKARPHDIYSADGLDRLLNASHHVWDDLVKADDQRELARYSDDEHAFLAAMVEWEIWGVAALSPLTCGQDMRDVALYWRNLRKLILVLRVPLAKRDFLLAGLERLEIFYRPMTVTNPL